MTYRFRCQDCGRVREQGPMIRDDLWRALVGPPTVPASKALSDIDDGHRLCLGCIEKRLGRKVGSGDLRGRHAVMVNGRDYPGLQHAAMVHGLAGGTVRYVIRLHGFTVEEAINYLLLPRGASRAKMLAELRGRQGATT